MTGISTACFYPMPTEKTIDIIASLGFVRAEVFLNARSELSARFIDSLSADMSRHGITAASVHTYSAAFEDLLLCSEYKRRRDEGRTLMRSIFKAARTLGARYLTLHGARSILPLDMRRYCDTLRWLIDTGAGYGIEIAMENVSWCRSSDPDFIRDLRECLRGENLCFTLDIKQARRAGRNVFEYMRVMSDKLVNVHINDFDDINTCLLPGRGTFSYDAFFSELSAISYDKDIIIEVYSDNFSDFNEIFDAKIIIDKLSTKYDI